MRKFRLYPRFMPVTPPAPLPQLTDNKKEKRSFFSSFHPFFHSLKKISPVCPPHHIPDLSLSEEVTAEFQLNEISHPSAAHFPTRMPNDHANKGDIPATPFPQWICILGANEGDSQRNGYDYRHILESL